MNGYTWIGCIMLAEGDYGRNSTYGKRDRVSTQVYACAGRSRGGMVQNKSFLHWETASSTLHAIGIGLFSSCVFLPSGHKNAHTHRIEFLQMWHMDTGEEKVALSLRLQGPY